MAASKIPVIIIPEEHSARGITHLDSYAAMLRSVTSELPKTSILCMTEGTDKALIYTKVFPTAPHMSEVSPDQPDINTVNCWKFGLMVKALVRDLDLESQRHSRYTEFGRSMAGIAVRRAVTDDDISEYGQLHLSKFGIREFMYPKYYTTPENKQKVYDIFRGLYQVYKQIYSKQPNYERELGNLLEAFKVFIGLLPECAEDSLTVDMVNELIGSTRDASGSKPALREEIMENSASVIREFLDTRMIDLIEAKVRENPAIQFVLINCGEGHYNSLVSKIDASSILVLEEATNKAILASHKRYLDSIGVSLVANARRYNRGGAGAGGAGAGASRTQSANAAVGGSRRSKLSRKTRHKNKTLRKR